MDYSSLYIGQTDPFAAFALTCTPLNDQSNVPIAETYMEK